MHGSPNRHHLLEWRVVPGPSLGWGRAPVQWDCNVASIVKCDDGGLFVEVLMPENLAVLASCIAKQWERIDGVQGGENTWHHLRQVMGQHSAVALASEVDAASVDAVFLLEVFEQSLDEGDIIHASRPVAPAAFSFRLARGIAGVLRRLHESEGTSCFVILCQTCVAVATRPNIPASPKIDDRRVVVARVLVQVAFVGSLAGELYAQSLSIVRQPQSHW
eukprot:CAMPEP_0206525860 /NCGR_PEP_ID=MMETSP0325_2-20121206/324_1 /ASSEMBLY_ACC=CAM_ASM_000347 /TAXON_ID=2866 /ORGANISM="Crypthecodinium cohnii, Strain Seligo" /LENGTH=218 /DNA_ID=CAMNT_0054020799 /DNA_START=203 /DNA_END=856 /DNA_ORIENTATION=-